MSAFKNGDRVVVQGNIGVGNEIVKSLNGVIMGVDVSASGDRIARVACETPYGLVVKPIFTRNLRRA